MKFGYFTLSDNRYPDNKRTPEQFLREIFEQAVYADSIGLHSAWIGEHHFNLLGINPCPNIMLAALASATKHIRLAPAVVLLPVHHPLHVAEEWATLDQLSGGRVDFAAGRGYDRAEYDGFGISFENTAEHFAEGLDVVWRAWTEPGKWSHHGAFYQFDNVEVRPRPLQSPLRPFVACFSRPSMELAARNDWNIIFAPFAAAMVYGDLKNAVDAYAAECAKHGRAARQSSCSYFIHIADDAQEERYGREALLRYFKDALIGAFPADPKKRAAQFALLLGHRENSRHDAGRGSDVEIGFGGIAGKDHRRAARGRGVRHQRSHSLLQLRFEAARYGQRPDAPFHGRHRARIRFRGSTCSN